MKPVDELADRNASQGCHRHRAIAVHAPRNAGQTQGGMR